MRYNIDLLARVYSELATLEKASLSSVFPVFIVLFVLYLYCYYCIACVVTDRSTGVDNSYNVFAIAN